ncbi:MAG: hypothetical protein D3904_04265 [Candidatus Electrothrix sp. EH2]|nr:hypothetical protein [Candidatus Electrothrix sp. EH2]
MLLNNESSAAEAVTATSCTAKILYIDDDQPNIAEAGKPISFTWKVQNQSSCTAEGYHLGFESSEPTASVDFGGMNHPPFTLAPWEKALSKLTYLLHLKKWGQHLKYILIFLSPMAQCCLA